MEWDDVVYLILLFFSIGFGFIYRKIEDTEIRKLVGTLVGLGIIVITSGIHILHIFIFTIVNILIILLSNRRKCHLISFGFSFTYLMFFRTTEYFGIPYPPAHTNLIIMILTLKLVGLAFELNTISYKNRIDLTEEEIAERACTFVDPKVIDIVHYAFNYIGVLTGPYYTYRSFWDSFHTKFYNEDICNSATIQKIITVPLFAILFLTATYCWPISYAWNDAFYNEHSFLYRLWYCIPVFFIFRMRIYIGIVLSECVCTMAGLGAYPTKVCPKPGAGPTKNFMELNNIYNSKKAFNEEINFETIHNVYPYGADFCTTFRDAMKHWNMCIQYWLAVNIYKRFPNKNYRTFATLFVSAVWHGVYIGHYFTICGAPFYLPIEDLYTKLFLKDKESKNYKLKEWVIWICKMCSFSYLSVAFHLLTVPRVLHYYNSIYHIGAIVGFAMYGLGIYIAKSKKREQKEKDALKKKE